MGRRLAERRKRGALGGRRGEAGLCFFRVAAATGFFLAVVVLAALARLAWSLRWQAQSQQETYSQSARMIANERLQTEGETARRPAREERKIQRKLRLQYGALKPYLVAESWHPKWRDRLLRDLLIISC